MKYLILVLTLSIFACGDVPLPPEEEIKKEVELPQYIVPITVDSMKCTNIYAPITHTLIYKQCNDIDNNIYICTTPN
jgi:hypothetical protein